MGRKINKVQVDLCSYPHYLIMGVKKVGKTTLFADLVDLLYPGHPEKGLLISCGNEEGYKALDDLQYEEAREWDKFEDVYGNRGLVQIVDELVELRGTPEQIDLVCLDTLDQLVDIATKQVFEEHRELKHTYPKSLNEALGGYSAGYNRVRDLIMEQINRINQAGMALFILAHTKLKEKNDDISGTPYEMITNSLDSRFYNPVADSAQMVVNIVMDRSVEGSGTATKKVKDKEVEVVLPGRQTKLERYMYFRENLFIDSGGRFKGLPEKLPLSAENFMKAFKMGVEASQKKKLTEEEYQDKLETEQNQNINKGVNLYKKEELQKKRELAQEINNNLAKNPPKEVLIEVSKVISEYGIKGFDDEQLESIETEQLQNILNILL